MSRSRPNIRTVNGAGRNPLLNSRYIRVQNRAAAVLDACEEFGEGYTIDLVAHLHRISVSQIETDLYGEPNVIERRFGFKSTIKLERALNQCQKELKKGENSALIAVANHVPFVVLRLKVVIRQEILNYQFLFMTKVVSISRMTTILATFIVEYALQN